MITFSGALPSGATKWTNAFMMIAGVMLGWMVSPVVWLVAGPFRMIAMLLAQSSQESGYNATVCGDAGSSCGIAQFQLATIEALGGDNDDRNSPFWSGYYSVRMVRKALLTKRGWCLIGVPIYGYAVLRYLWTHGWNAASPWENAWSKKGPGGSLAEPRAWGSFLLWRLLSLLPLAGAAWLWRRQKDKLLKARRRA